MESIKMLNKAIDLHPLMLSYKYKLIKNDKRGESKQNVRNGHIIQKPLQKFIEDSAQW